MSAGPAAGTELEWSMGGETVSRGRMRGAQAGVPAEANAVGATRANAALAVIGHGGKSSMSISQNSGHVVLAVLGCFSSKSPGRFVALAPECTFETRTANAPTITATEQCRSTAAGGIPADATAGVLSVTATEAVQSLDLQAFPTCDRPQRRTSTLNSPPDRAVANLDNATIGDDGSVTRSVSRS